MNNTLLNEKERRADDGIAMVSGKERLLVTAFSIVSLVMLFMNWFHLPGLAVLYSYADFSGIGLINLSRALPSNLVELDKNILVLPGVCQGLCVVLHAATLLLLLFGDNTNGVAASAASALVSLCVSAVLFGLSATSDASVFLTGWFYLFILLSILNMVFSARIALGHKMLS